jgi:hypothetical protein
MCSGLLSGSSLFTSWAPSILHSAASAEAIFFILPLRVHRRRRDHAGADPGTQEHGEPGGLLSQQSGKIESNWRMLNGIPDVGRIWNSDLRIQLHDYHLKRSYDNECWDIRIEELEFAG